VALVREKQTSALTEEQALGIEKIKRRLDMLDQRLDNIDTMVTAVAERVTKQPMTLLITCPNCGKEIEVAIIGSEKPKG
jgi:predicted Zn-ribbon and HTH transcriptional regulator